MSRRPGQDIAEAPAARNVFRTGLELTELPSPSKRDIPDFARQAPVPPWVTAESPSAATREVLDLRVFLVKSGDVVSQEILDLACGDPNKRSLDVVPSIRRLT